MKKDLKEAILGIEVTQFDGQRADLEELVNPKQLEKIISDWMPEILSQEWIDEHIDYADVRGGTQAFINVSDLQKLLVPKQEIREEQAWDIIKDIYGISNEAFVRSVMRLVMEHVKDDTTIGEIREKLESEVLSKEWIDWHKEFVGKRPDGTRVEVVKEKYLQNLLVPKQPFGNSEELPVIPEFVAEWIEMKRDRYENDLLLIGSDFYNDYIQPDVDDWLMDNEEKFVRAWIDGYTVEEEPQYRLKAGGNYLYFRLDGTVRGTTKDNATITKGRLEQLPFDVEKAVESGIIEVEELEEC